MSLVQYLTSTELPKKEPNAGLVTSK
jgi:hypothetical protein